MASVRHKAFVCARSMPYLALFIYQPLKLLVKVLPCNHNNNNHLNCVRKDVPPSSVFQEYYPQGRMKAFYTEEHVAKMNSV